MKNSIVAAKRHSPVGSAALKDRTSGRTGIEAHVKILFVGILQMNPMRMMITEHDGAGEFLTEIRRITGNYSVPADACIRFQTLYEACEERIWDASMTMQHPIIS